MKLSYLSALNQPYAKKTGILFAGIFILLEIVAKLTGTLEAIDLPTINVFILATLFMAVFSKEKTDDERTRIIRYFSLKTSFQLLILGISINYLGMIINYWNSIVEPIYIAIASLILYLLIFHLANYFNPGFIFKEETTEKKGSIKLAAVIMAFIAIATLYNIITTIIPS